MSVATALLACGLDAVGSKIVGTEGGNDATIGDSSAAVMDVAVPDGAPPLDATVDTAPPDAAPATSVGATTVASSSITLDRVSPADGAIAPDGQNDGIFDVLVTGPAIALTLIRTDAAGAPSGNQQWDTWVGADVIPAALGAVFVAGSSTYQLGVQDVGGALLNDASGRLALPAGPHALQLAGSNVGSFVAGRFFRVVAQRPDGTLVRGPVVAY